MPRSAPRRLIARGKLPAPGQGPSADVRAKSWFRLLLVGTADDGRRLLTQVSGADPGYDETAKMVSEAAVLLACERGQLPRVERRGGFGGVVTPAFALGESLRAALDARGIRFFHHAGAAADDEAIARAVRAALERGPDHLTM